MRLPGTYISPADLELYYLNSRYYDSNTGRFISPDKYISTGQGLLGYNMFAYCGNNPVNRIDPTGEAWHGGTLDIVVCVAVVVVAVAVNHAVNGIMSAMVDNEIDDTYTKDAAKAEIEKITGEGTVNFLNTNVQINNSANVHSRYDRIKVSKIIQNTVDDDGNNITDRTTYGLSAEWFGHNVINFFNGTERTRNVNLDYRFKDNEWYTEAGTILFMILGCL